MDNIYGFVVIIFFCPLEKSFPTMYDSSLLDMGPKTPIVIWHEGVQILGYMKAGGASTCTLARSRQPDTNMNFFYIFTVAALGLVALLGNTNADGVGDTVVQSKKTTDGLLTGNQVTGITALGNQKQ